MLPRFVPKPRVPDPRPEWWVDEWDAMPFARRMYKTPAEAIKAWAIHSRQCERSEQRRVELRRARLPMMRAELATLHERLAFLDSEIERLKEASRLVMRWQRGKADRPDDSVIKNRGYRHRRIAERTKLRRRITQLEEQL